MISLEIIDVIADNVPKFMLIFARLSAMCMTLPIISYPMVNPRLRITIALVLSLVMLPILNSATPEMNNFVQLFLVLVHEITLGLILGFGARLLFEALSMAGGFIGNQMGIAIANVMDPMSRQQTPLLNQFFFLIIIMTFLSVNGHHLLIETLTKNFFLIPVGGGRLVPQLGQQIVQGGSNIFLFSLKFAAPAMVFLLLVDTAVALTARVMPQMNIFMVTLPLKIGAGMFVVIFSLDMFQLIFDSIYLELSDFIAVMMLNIGGA